MNKIITFFLLFFFLACQPNNKTTSSFGLTSEETLSMITSGTDLLSPDQAVALHEKSPDQYQLIDLRSEAEFIIGHLEGAVNIPTQYLLEEEHTSVWTNAAVTKILYGSNQLQGNGPWLLLRQLGYENIKVMEGGYDFITMPSDSTTGPSSFVAERARYDYPAIFKLSVEESEEALKSQKVVPVPVKQAPKKVAPKKKKVKEEDEGGC